MPYQTRIASALAARGLKVETVRGWQSRGSSAFNPRGVTCHWTAGPHNAPAHSRPSLNVVVNGRPGLSGPLCNVYLDRRGIPVVVAAGRANHAGAGGYRGLSGNSSVFGIEAESGGDVPFSDWTAAQRKNYPIVVAALVDLTPSNTAKYVHGHNEWTPRKIDIRDWPMSRMRSEVNAILQGGDMVTAREIVNYLMNVYEMNPYNTGKDYALPKESVGRRFRRLSDDAARGLVLGRRNAASIKGLEAAVKALGEQQGVDPEVIERTVREATEAALADVSITLSAQSEED